MNLCSASDTMSWCYDNVESKNALWLNGQKTFGNTITKEIIATKIWPVSCASLYKTFAVGITNHKLFYRKHSSLTSKTRTSMKQIKQNTRNVFISRLEKHWNFNMGSLLLLLWYCAINGGLETQWVSIFQSMYSCVKLNDIMWIWIFKSSLRNKFNWLSRAWKSRIAKESLKQSSENSCDTAVQPKFNFVV